MIESSSRLNAVYAALSTSGVTLIVGIVAYLIFQATDGLDVVSISFLCGVPFVLGVMTVLLAPAKYRASKKYGILMPWLPSLTLGIVLWILGWELAICVIIGMPIVLGISSFGGLAMAVNEGKRQGNAAVNRKAMLSIVLILPYIIAPIENLFSPSDDFRTVESTIQIEADAATIWGQIIAVPQIHSEERPFSFLDLADFPRLMEATLSHEGIGGMRQATYDNGLVLLEPVTEWSQPTGVTRFTCWRAWYRSIVRHTISFRNLGDGIQRF